MFDLYYILLFIWLLETYTHTARLLHSVTSMPEAGQPFSLPLPAAILHNTIYLVAICSVIQRTDQKCLQSMMSVNVMHSYILHCQDAYGRVRSRVWEIVYTDSFTVSPHSFFSSVNEWLWSYIHNFHKTNIYTEQKYMKRCLLHYIAWSAHSGTA